MRLAVACSMPLVVMGFVFFLARIEDRHLTARRMPAPVPRDGEKPIAPERP